MSTLPAHWPFESFQMSASRVDRIVPEQIAGAVVIEVADERRRDNPPDGADIDARGPLRAAGLEHSAQGPPPSRRCSAPSSANEPASEARIS